MKLKREKLSFVLGIFLGIGLCATAAASVYLAKLYLRAREKERSLAQKITSCEAADRTKPKARLCEPWVNFVTNLFGAAERRTQVFGVKNLLD